MTRREHEDLQRKLARARKLALEPTDILSQERAVQARARRRQTRRDDVLPQIQMFEVQRLGDQRKRGGNDEARSRRQAERAQQVTERIHEHEAERPEYDERQGRRV